MGGGECLVEWSNAGVTLGVETRPDAMGAPCEENGGVGPEYAGMTGSEGVEFVPASADPPCEESGECTGAKLRM